MNLAGFFCFADIHSFAVRCQQNKQTNKKKYHMYGSMFAAVLHHHPGGVKGHGQRAQISQVSAVRSFGLLDQLACWLLSNPTTTTPVSTQPVDSYKQVSRTPYIMKCIFHKLCNKHITPHFAFQFPMFATNYTTFCAAKHFKHPDLHFSLPLFNFLLYLTNLYLTCCLPLFIYLFIFTLFTLHLFIVTQSRHFTVMQCNASNEIVESRILL